MYVMPDGHLLVPRAAAFMTSLVIAVYTNSLLQSWILKTSGKRCRVRTMENILLKLPDAWGRHAPPIRRQLQYQFTQLQTPKSSSNTAAKNSRHSMLQLPTHSHRYTLLCTLPLYPTEYSPHRIYCCVALSSAVSPREKL